MSTNISFSGSIPEFYDLHLGPLFFEPYALDLIQRISGKNFTSVLELACGTGRVTQYLTDALPASKITATDLNPDMIEIAKKKIDNKNVVWDKTDMQEIPFEDSAFDLVICQFGLMFVPDKIKAYREIYRVLKPGGVFLFNTWDKIETNGPAFTADEIINSFFNDDPVTFYQVPFSYFNKDEIKKELKEGGFKEILISSIRKEVNVVSAADAAKGLIEGNPAINSINERDPALLPVIKENLKSALSNRFGSDPMEYDLNAFVIETIK